ncbi:hypothetical protein DBR11_08590 [Pedobacter sp. HMWF019]|uniref:TonB-dependent receptor n=1 Tax=Pedobacter sp. HMWF019 TaxID=2056856 RepID=UPI000D3B466D|nr:TonB-dependent receptor [Pedobacter sp. HMWF019]PTT00935.1 hypothetical protein DBR11_08590 [Pedobacter sp. HMWF019]
MKFYASPPVMQGYSFNLSPVWKKCRHLCADRDIKRKILMRIKLTFIMLVTVFLQISNASYGQRISLSERNTPLGQILKKIQNQTEYKILYADELIHDAHPVTINVTNGTLEEVLAKCFQYQNLSYIIKEKTIVVKPKQITTWKDQNGLLNEQILIKGTVSDHTGQPLSGVSVRLKGTSVAVSTDGNGNFSLKVPDQRGSLVFSYIGYIVKEVPLSAGPVISVTLEEEVNAMNEVVVVGYGTQKKSSLTAAVSTVKMQDLENNPRPNIISSLAGRVPGMTISETSGEPGSSPSIIVRGIGTIDGASSDPLVLIDGVPGGNLGTLAPGDIESISVLKDAAAASIYGARAANGVILVTTKKGGKMDKAEINFNTYAGFQSPTTFPKTINAFEYATLLNEAATNEGKTKVYSDDDLRLFQDGTDPDMHANTNWLDEITQKNALISNNYLSASGNSAIGRYFLSGEYLYQKGSVKTIDHYHRINLRSNVTSKISDKLELQMLASYLRTNRDANWATGLFNQALRASATSPVRFSDGHWGGQMFANGNYLTSTFNPVSVIEQYGPVSNNLTQYNVTGSLNYKPIKNLTVNVMGSFIGGYADNSAYNKKSESWDFITRKVSQYIPNSLNEDWNKENKYNLQVTATYEKTFGDHYFKAMGGYSQESYRIDKISAYRRDFINDELYELNAGDAATQTNNGSADHWAFMSGFSRLNYAYKDKYLLEVTARYDGSSRFAKDHRWGLFPSVSLGWNMQKEKFMENMKAVDLLKLRFSYGQLGNAEKVGLYESYANLNSGAYYNFDDKQVVGVLLGNPANTNLSWETTSTYNLGLDGSFYKGLLGFEFDLWKKQTNDILLSVPVSTVIGLPSSRITTNAGKVGSHGYDFMLTHSKQINADWSYNASFTISGWKSWIIDLKDRATPFSDSLRPGGDLGDIYGYQVTGIINSQEQLKNYKNLDGVPPQIGLGDLAYKDQNGDGRIDYLDKVKIGNSYVKTQFGLNLGMKYKNFDLNVFLQGAGNTNRVISDYIRNVLLNYNSPLAVNLDRWTPENHNANAQFPRILQNYDHNRSDSDWWIRNGSYLRLKNLQIGYTFPSGMLQKSKIQSLRLYAAASNLFTYAPDYVDGFDPERDINNDWYPNFRVISFGVNLKF